MVGGEDIVGTGRHLTMGILTTGGFDANLGARAGRFVNEQTRHLKLTDSATPR